MTIWTDVAPFVFAGESTSHRSRICSYLDNRKWRRALLATGMLCELAEGYGVIRMNLCPLSHNMIILPDDYNILWIVNMTFWRTPKWERIYKTKQDKMPFAEGTYSKGSFAYRTADSKKFLRFNFWFTMHVFGRLTAVVLHVHFPASHGSLVHIILSVKAKLSRIFRVKKD